MRARGITGLLCTARRATAHTRGLATGRRHADGQLRLWELAGREDNRLFSPFCWAARMALAHKGLRAETVPWRLTEKERIAFSGQGSAPVLEDNDVWVSDSWAIAVHLDNKYPHAPPLFGSPDARAQAYFVKVWCDDVLKDKLRPVILMDIFRHLHPKDAAYYRESREKRFGMTLEQYTANQPEHIARFREALHPFSQTLAAQPYLCGPTPGFSDYMLFGCFQWSRVISKARVIEPHGPVHEWRERLLRAHGGVAQETLAYPLE